MKLSEIDREGVRRNQREINMLAARCNMQQPQKADLEHLVDLAFRQGFTQGYADANNEYQVQLRKITDTVFTRQH